MVAQPIRRGVLPWMVATLCAACATDAGARAESVRLKPRLLPTMLRWVDVENGRVLFEHGWQVTQGLPTTAQTLEFSHWRDAGGVDLPAHVERQSLFGGKLTIDYDVLEANPAIAPAIFACPDSTHSWGTVTGLLTR
jgi:hypothetical protein